MAAVRWVFMYEDSPREFADLGVTAPTSYRQAGSYYRCYYDDPDVALQAYQALGLQYNPNQTWLFEAPIETVMLPEETRAKFGSVFSLESRINTLRSVKYRHEFQLISLPAAVAAYARMKGWIDYSFDLSELNDQDVVVTDEFAAGLIGGEYGADGETIKVPYTDAALWQRRVALWSDLGESDPRVYCQKGARRYATSSDRLNECLGIVAQSWTGPIWAGVLMVQDPRVDAISKGSGNRLTLPALNVIYEDEAEAREASNVGEGETAATPGKPPLPKDYKGLESAWLTVLGDLKGQVTGPTPVVRARLQQMEADDELYNRIAATADEALAWWDLV